MVSNKLMRISLAVLGALMGLAAVVSGPALIATNGLGMPAGWMENSPSAATPSPDWCCS